MNPSIKPKLIYINEEWSKEPEIKQYLNNCNIPIWTTYNNAIDRNSYLESPVIDRLFNDVFKQRKPRGSGKVHRVRALGSIVLASCRTYLSLREEIKVSGFLYSTRKGNTPIKRYQNANTSSPAAKIDTLKQLQKYGYITLFIGKSKRFCSFGSSGLQNLVLPTEKLWCVIREVLASPTNLVKDNTKELIELKGHDKELSNYKDDGFTNRSRKLLSTLNTANSEYRWSYLTNVTRVVIASEDLALTRKFIDNFDCHGRLYWSGISTIRRRERATIMIDDKETAELDFSASHPRILYAHEGLSIGNLDPYQAKSFERWKGKCAMLVAVNCKNRNQATSCLIKREFKTGEYNENGQNIMRTAVSNRQEAKQLLSELEEHNKPVAHRFYTEGWKWLMKIESDVVCRVIEGLSERHIPALPVHDSFVVRICDKAVTEHLMYKAFKEITGSDALIKES